MNRTDLRVAVRSLLQRPLLTGIAVLTLALGIGANATIFSLADAVAFRPLPVRDPGSLVAIYATRHEGVPMGFSFPDYLDLRGGIAGMAQMAGYSEAGFIAARGNGDATPAWGELVTESYFPMLGITPEAGRFFTTDEAGRDGQGGAPVAIVSHDFLVTRLGGDRTAIGSTIRLNDRVFTIVGVTPRGFDGTRSLSWKPEIWVPIAQQRTLFPDWGDTLQRRNWGGLHLLGRLAPGARMDTVQAAASTAAHRLAAAYPTATFRDDVMVLSNRTAINPYLGTPRKMQTTALLMLLGVGLVLLVACANVANLMLVRASGRRRELAVRASLGAGGWHLARQLLLESLFLALGGAAAGLAIAVAATRPMQALLPHTEHPLAIDVRLDLRVTLFALGLAVLSTLLFGLWPARRAARTDPAGELRGGRGARDSGAGTRSLNVMVVAQVAFSLVVMIAAGLFVRNLSAANHLDLGFQPDGALVFGVDASLRPDPPADPDRLQRRIADAVSSLPGVAAVGYGSDLPLDGNNEDTIVAPLGQAQSPTARVTAGLVRVGGSFFAVMKVPLRSGRGFGVTDGDSAIERVVVSEALARRLFPGRDAIGQRFELAGTHPQPLEVIGVAGDVKENWLGESPQPFLYFDAHRNATSEPLFVVRTSGDQAAVFAAIRARVRGIDPQLPLTNVGTLREHLSPAFSLPRNGAWVATAFALLALLLASSGIFGVIAYLVALRGRELAIRLAVGASPRKLLGSVLGSTLRILGIGVAIGLVGGALVGGLLGGLLYGISPRDPFTLAIAAATVLAVGLLATLAPAARVLRVDPSSTLRSEA